MRKLFFWLTIFYAVAFAIAGDAGYLYPHWNRIAVGIAGLILLAAVWYFIDKNNNHL